MATNRVLIDNNALADLFVGEAALERDARELRKKHLTWVAPPLIRYEFGNVLRTYVRFGKKTEVDAATMLSKGLGMVVICEEPPETMIFAEANANNLTFYDATYVACARALGLTLHTRDGDILKSCPDIAKPISGA